MDCSIDISPENWRNGEIIGGDDCDDTDEHTYVGRAYLENPTSCMRDMDLDGYGDQHVAEEDVTAGSDCDDANADIYPAAIEYCDGFSTTVTIHYGVRSHCPLMSKMLIWMDMYLVHWMSTHPIEKQVEVVGGLDCDDSNSRPHFPV